MKVMDLKKTFGSFVAVNGIDLDLYEGQIFSLLGHNGAVKKYHISVFVCSWCCS